MTPPDLPTLEAAACSACGERKSRADFYRGHARCKACYSIQVKAWRAANAERYLAAERARRARVPIEQERARRRDWKRTNRDKSNQMLERYRERYPEKNHAHRLISRAIERGDIQRPTACQWCGAGGRIEASHGDYSKPYAVEWLCVPCHRERDRKTG